MTNKTEECCGLCTECAEYDSDFDEFFRNADNFSLPFVEDVHNAICLENYECVEPINTANRVCKKFKPIFPAFTKALFRATRETMGISRAEFAKAIDVDVRTVNRWETNDKMSYPTLDAWRLLYEMKETFDVYYENIIDGFDEIYGELDDLNESSKAIVDCVALTYYENQQDFEERNEEGMITYEFFNAITKRVAAYLEDIGCQVIYAYPGEDELADLACKARKEGK